MKKATTRRGVWLLLLLALLTVSVVALLSISGSADAEEIQNFGCQAPLDYDMIDSTTNLRFVFTVPANKVTGYTDAGFVFSKSVEEPTVGGESCATAHATSAYESITADGKTTDAGEGRYWIAVKLINIPQSYFDGPIHVRAFVTDGEGTRYSDAAEVTVWGMNAIEYHSNWSLDTRNANDYTIANPDDAGIKTFGVKKTVRELWEDEPDSVRFFPNADNDYTGNDLLIEFSFLYNNTMSNAKDGVLTVMYIENNNVFNINLKTGKISNNAREDDVVLYKADDSGNISIGGYGWHRFGVRIHQEGINDNGVEDYQIIATAYLDGEKILQVDKTAYAKTKTGTYTGKLFHLYPYANRLIYGIIGKSTKCDAYLMVEDIYKSSANAGYLVLQDLSFSCGQTFKQQVTKVVSPASKTFKASDGTELTGDVYFTAAAAHDHDWDGDYTLTKAPTLLENGLKAEHCTICGAARTVTATPAEMIPVILNANDAAPTGWQGNSANDFMAPKQSLKALADDNGHFYPTNSNPSGNDLLIEFSILWNDTLHADSGKYGNLGIFSGTTTINTSWIYFDNGQIELNDGGTGAETIYVKKTSPDPDYYRITGNGWHRIGIRYHQTAEIVDASVAYTFTYTIYVDGERVSEVKTSNTRFANNNYLLYTATIENEKLKYSDGASNRYLSWLFVSNFFNAGKDKYLVLADLNINAAHEFVQQVEPVSPVAAPFDLGSYDPAVMYYQPVTP